MKIDRRKFNKFSFISALALGTNNLMPLLLAEGKTRESMVVQARSDKLKRDRHNVSQQIAVRFINEALMRITKTNSSLSAWKSLFSRHEKVGVKLSCLPGKYLSSSQGIVMAVVDGLLSAGVKGENIIIWERTDRELERAGFKITRKGINIFGTDNLSRGGYSHNVEISGSVGTCFSQIMAYVDALINIPVLKDHDIAGVSIGMKNFFGAIHNPNKFHSHNCDPYIADLNNHPVIRRKLRLIICDASRVQVHNGPAFFPEYSWDYGGLLVSLDPVALDYLGWQVIEKRRKKLKLKTLKDSGREPSYIKTAEKLNLGNANESDIKMVEL